MFKLDLHTHSTASPDGGLKPEQYAKLIEDNVLDYVAVTDHDRLDAALHLHETLGEHIIVGEEITTRDGELIGLFLKKTIAPGQSALATAEAIKSQGGLVYVPHPFETVRKGIPGRVLDNISSIIDIVEIHNARALFQNRGPEAATWARLYRKTVAASSDAHGLKGLGTTYTLIPETPSPKNLARLLGRARFITARPPLHTLLYPKMHRLKKRLGREA